MGLHGILGKIDFREVLDKQQQQQWRCALGHLYTPQQPHTTQPGGDFFDHASRINSSFYSNSNTTTTTSTSTYKWL